MDNTFPNTADAPLISVLMANYNGEKYIRQAMQSVLAQTHGALELILSDDGSQDQSIAIVKDIMASDDRVRLLRSETPSGPAGARNAALEAATGAWIAIVDSDDIIHPERLARMLSSAMALRVDMVADDLVFFAEDLSEKPRTLFQDLDLAKPEMVDALALIEGRLPGRRAVPLGYVKPLIRREAIGDTRYNTNLRVDEDHDFYLRLLLSGARFALIPDALYLYRRHAASLSHRFSVAKLQPMIAVQDALFDTLPEEHADLRPALSRRIETHRKHLHYARLIDALKARHAFAALGLLLRYPTNWALLARTMKERALRKGQGPVVAKKRMKVILAAGADAEVDYPGFTVLPVPAAPGAGWVRSSATIWANLARLSCEYDLHVIAVGRAGSFALGLVPVVRATQVLDAAEDIHAMIARDSTANQPTGAAHYASSL